MFSGISISTIWVIIKSAMPSSGEIEKPISLFSSLPVLFPRDVRLLILEHSRWSMVEKYQALTAGLTSDELMAFSQHFRAELYAEGLVQGNFSSTVSGQ